MSSIVKINTVMNWKFWGKLDCDILYKNTKKSYNNVKTKGQKMKRAVNLRLDESVIITLNQLSNELHTTKTDVIEKAIEFFSKENRLKQNGLLQFAGKLKSVDADAMLERISSDKNSKNFELDL